MKISKILAGVSSMAIVAAMAIPAAAGNGAPIGVPEGWTLDAKKTMASRFIIGNPEDGSMLENTQENWEKMFTATTVRVTIQGDYFGEEDWAADGSIVLNQNYWGWSQVDWNLGAGCYNMNDDGTIKEVNPEKNANVSKVYVDGNKYTIEITGPGFCKANGIEPETNELIAFMKTAQEKDGWDLSADFLSLNVQCFNEDATKSWNILGFEFVDANGGVVLNEGEVAMGDVYDPAAAIGGGSSNTDTSSDSTGDKTSDSTSGDKTSNTTPANSTTSGGKTSTTSSSSNKSGSDKTADTGAATGVALAGIALAGAAFVISKKK